jgi:hypothetical protein
MPPRPPRNGSKWQRDLVASGGTDVEECCRTPKERPLDAGGLSQRDSRYLVALLALREAARVQRAWFGRAT